MVTIETLFPLNNERVCILGMLSRGSGDTLLAEDLTGSVKLNMDEVQYGSGLFFEGGIFVFTGEFIIGKLHV